MLKDNYLKLTPISEIFCIIICRKDLCLLKILSKKQRSLCFELGGQYLRKFQHSRFFDFNLKGYLVYHFVSQVFWVHFASFCFSFISTCKFILFYKLPFLLWPVLVLGVLIYSLTCKLLRLSLQ